ncbi:hypothetical protein FISHEDRAFT_73383 [Fistulina hepatica ATCC 64428]|uniref:CxC1-like cysteine cluster associated with KDZ transposases domain-containing protein n=1 Tax=Fistulina hepatica ATCC 64428 TaxID=1128425 RepID=A0A0D7ACW0_9AGAR|nr:hypothetical protein FISHEDRAFT_73383 [Fistulina hepatica ATCC 64428]
MHCRNWRRAHEKTPPPGQALFEDPELDEELRQMMVEDRRKRHRQACKKYYEKHREKLLEKAAERREKERRRLENMNNGDWADVLALIRYDQREYQREWRKYNRSKLAAKACARRRGQGRFRGGMSGRRMGVTKKSRITYGSTDGLRKVILKRTYRMREEIERERRRERELIAALPNDACDELLQRELGDASGADDGHWYDDDDNDILLSGLGQAAPGTEGELFSGAGAEGTFFDLAHSVLRQKRYGDLRTRHNRILQQVISWQLQLPELKRAYLHWKACRKKPDSMDSDADVPISHYNVTLYSFEGIRQEAFAVIPSCSGINEILVSHGAIGATPDSPQVAFTIDFLETYRQLHRVCPRLSLEAVSKALLHLHQRPRKSYLARQLSGAYDAYLSILRAVECDIQAALHQSDIQMQAERICAPFDCFKDNVANAQAARKAKGRKKGTAASAAALASTASTPVISPIPAASTTMSAISTSTSVLTDYAPTPSTSATAVASPPSPQAASASVAAPTAGGHPCASDESSGHVPDLGTPNDNIPWLNINEADDGLKEDVNKCVDRWRNAGPEAQKKMVELFAISGIFITLCRHGHVLVICDMIRSGELMKYPIAQVNYLIDTYGKDIGLGYNIMCAFMKTLSSSSIADKVKSSRLVGIVPSFHGHAHSCSCQVDWHPNYVPGMGKEDAEGSEHFFSRSNELAAGTRMCSQFHRRQQLDEYIRFNDDDKYASLLQISKQYKLKAADYERFLEEERAYLKSLQKEPAQVTQRCEYMELLQKYMAALIDSRKAREDFDDIGGSCTPLMQIELGKIQRQFTQTANRVMLLDEELSRMEEVMGLPARWTTDAPEYVEGLKDQRKRRFRQAVDEVERLVVQRLLELTKLNMSGVGYKQREKIRKALQAHSQAIRKALDQYNEAA